LLRGSRGTTLLRPPGRAGLAYLTNGAAGILPRDWLPV